MANMKCIECGQPLGERHLRCCSDNDIVEIRDCPADTVAADSPESPSELSLHLSDRLHFEDKL